MILVARAETVAKECGTTAARPTDVIDDVRTYYDNGALGAAPSKGFVTKTERINGKGDGYDTLSSVPSTCGAAKTELCYDQYGRALAKADAYGKVTTTTYTPASGEVATGTVMTDPLGHTVTSVLEPLRGQATKVTDANNKVTTTAYDALGRARKVWLPTRSATTYPESPNYEFNYLVRNNGPIVTTTKTLTHDAKFLTSYAFADGLLRPFQEQQLSPDRSGRLVTETFYDTRGLVWRSSGVYYTEGAPEAVPVTGQELKYPASADIVYDGAGRVTAVIARRFGDETKRTTTSYTGDKTTVIPPKGGTATTTTVDALGRTTELKQYTNAERTASQSTTYTHNDHGLLEQVTDPSGAKWTYTYDVRGRQVKVDDPDKGVSTTVYDKGDRVTDITDVARNITLHSDYDALGRKTFLKKGTTTLAAWTYDTATNGKGQPATSTRYISGKAYVSAVTAYNELYQPEATQVTIPDSEGKLAGTYQWQTYYNDKTGQVEYVDQPAMADLPVETLGITYTPVTGQLMAAGVDYTPLISASTYDHYGRTTRQEYNDFGKKLIRTNVYDDHTSQLTQSYLDRQVAPQRVEDTTYGYDPAGNVTSIATGYGQNTARTTDTQCVVLDALTRITEAWTNTGEQCASAPSTSAVGGPDAYWTSYTYDAVGNRKTETQHKTASGPTADTVRTYAAPDAGKHNLPKVTQTGTNAHEETFTYDAAGNTKTRKIGTAETQTLDWDDEGHLQSVTQVADTTNYLYGAGGERIVRRDSTGTTLYLPGGNELHLDKNGTATGTRYYSAGSVPIAMRTGGKVTFLFSDHHGTGTTQITSDAAQTVTRRKSTIFGAPRGTQPTNWVGDKGFVGGTKDTDTGLTNLGAREYDPGIGRFISVDPVMDLADPQQIHGYTYANNNPVSLSDPSGLAPDGRCGGINTTCGPPGSVKTVNESWTQTKDGWSYESWTPDGDNYSVPAGVGSGYTWGILQNRPKNWEETFEATSSAPLPIIAIPSMAISAAIDIKDGDFDPGEYINCTDGIVEAAGCVATAIPALKTAKNVITAVKKADNFEDGVKAAKKAAGSSSTPEPSGCPTHSFASGTEVLLADGSTKKIEDVKEGDEVVATDPETGKTYKKKVIDTILTEDDKYFTELTVNTDEGEAALVATDNHPFWSVDQDTWVGAGHLKPGTKLRTSDGRTIEVQGTWHYKKRQRTHDLTVNDIHTYYVLAGQTPVLVHNATPGQKCDLTLGAGPNAREGVGLENGDIEADGVRDLINESGNKYGCHTCDATTPGTKYGDWIPDHQPPSSLVAPGSPQTAYPHCWTCARRQAGVASQLSQARSKKEW
ncbi:hypothetical protein STENM223S_03188 [Streptomyces tendae]